MKPHDFGKKFLTDQCQQVRLSDFIRKARPQFKEAFLQSVIEAEGYRLLLNKSKTGFGGLRYWFACPLCQRRAGVIYKHPVSHILGCRRCLGLDYRKHRYKGMVESVVQ